MRRDAGERRYYEGIAPLTCQKGETRAELPFHNSVIGNFIIYDRLKTNIL